MTKYSGQWKKGETVYLRNGWSQHPEIVDMGKKYRIRSIGSKRTVLDAIREDGTILTWGTRQIDLIPELLAEKYNGADFNKPFPRYPWKWSQILVSEEKVEWDA